MLTNCAHNSICLIDQQHVIDFDLKSLHKLVIWKMISNFFRQVILILIWNHFENDYTQHCSYYSRVLRQAQKL